MYFTQRYIDVTFEGPETISLTRHRVSARVRVAGDPAMGVCELAIYGMSLDKMNKLATFGQPIHPQYNYKLTVKAGDQINGMSLIFSGQIQQAWADFQAMPDVPFHVVAYQSTISAIMRDQGGQDWNSYSGPTDVSQILKNLAGKMGFQFEDGGLSGLKLMNPYHFGSPFRQAQQVREAADICMVVENGVLAAWPQNQARPGSGPYISRDTGMVAYPTFTEYGVLVKTEFTRYVNFGVNMTIQSDITPANGQWSIRQTDYDLQSLVPNGHWFVDLYGAKPNVNIPFIPQF